MDLKLHDSRTRVGRWLADAAKGAGGTRIKLSVPKAMLARNLGMTPESFSRALAALQAAGAIAATGSSIAILNRGLLEHMPARQGQSNHPWPETAIRAKVRASEAGVPNASPRSGSAPRSARAGGPEHHPQRLGDDQEVEQDGEVLHVVEVV